MTDLLANYHPDIRPLSTAFKEALLGSLSAQAVTPPGGWRIVLARVSDQSRKKFQDNLDQDMDWLCWHPQAAWVKAHVTDVEAFRATPAGHKARARVGMHPLYAPGTKRLIGAFLARDGWLFIFLLSSAAKADLPLGRNAVTEAILASLLAVAHHDPHDQASRPLLYAHALDRILRSEPYAWTVFGALTCTYALVDAAGREFDALSSNAKDDWTLITFGAARGRDDTARRFLLSRLNKVRAGNWPGNTIGLPRGYMPGTEPDTQGRFNLEPTDAQLSVRRPEPDPRQRWEVRTIAKTALRKDTTTLAALTRECGLAGLTSRGTDEGAMGIDQLRDPTSAGRTLIAPEKIRAYCTGLLRHTETGVTPGQFTPGDGHRLQPRFPGDSLGAYTADVRVGRPEDTGWTWGITPIEWRDLLLKWWLPRDFTPQGWTWKSPPTDWDWDTILTAAQQDPPRQDTGQAAAKDSMRPFCGIHWSDDTHRHLLYSTASSSGGDRYTWRRETHAASRRYPTGERYRMASTDGDVVSSWFVSEFHDAWADLAEQAYTAMIDEHPDAESLLDPDQPDPATSTTSQRQAAAHAARQAAETNLQATIDELTADLDAFTFSAAHARRRGEDRAADLYERQATDRQTSIDRATEQLDKLRNAPLPEPEASQVEVADFGQPAAIIAALKGPFRTGAAPRSLRDAIRNHGGEQTRLHQVDAATVRLEVEVTLRRHDGTHLTSTASSLLRRSRPNTNTNQARAQRSAAKAELARKWFYDGITLDELKHLSGASTDHAYRIVREQLATGTPRTVGQPALDSLSANRIPLSSMRAAITAHPIPEARACIWSSLNPNDPVPTGLHPHYPELIETTYRQSEHRWDPRSPMRDPHADHRIDALTVLRHLPDPQTEIRADHLAALVGAPVRQINIISTTSGRAHTATPATLARPTGWGGTGSSHLPPHLRTVALHPCPWTDCGTPTADALLLLPELIIGAQTSVVCRTCMRPPTRNLVLPDSYRPLISATETRTGTWVQCASPTCRTDLSAGTGITWRWDDTPASDPSHHPGCVPPQSRPPSNATIRTWARKEGLPVTDRGRIPQDILSAFLLSERSPSGGPGTGTTRRNQSWPASAEPVSPTG